MTRSTFTSTFLASLLIFSPAVTSAQGAAPQQELLQTLTFKVMPGRQGMFEQWWRAVIRATVELGHDTNWYVAQSMSGEPTYLMTSFRGTWDNAVVPPVFSDFPDIFGAEEANRLYGLGGNSIESMTSSYYLTAPNLSVPRPESDVPPAAVVIFDQTIPPNETGNYLAGAALTREAALAVAPDLHYASLQPLFGASAVRVIIFVEDWADLADGGNPGQMVIQHFGQPTGVSINQRMGGSIASQTATLYRVRDDLSLPEEN